MFILDLCVASLLLAMTRLVLSYYARYMQKEGEMSIVKQLGVFAKRKSLHQPGIEPGSVPWQGTILPLDHWCTSNNFPSLYLTSVIERFSFSRHSIGSHLFLLPIDFFFVHCRTFYFIWRKEFVSHLFPIYIRFQTLQSFH